MSVDRVRLALTQIAEAWPYLADAKDAALRRRRPEPRQLGARAALTLDDLIRAERGDRVLGERARRVPQPAMPTPAALDVVDAEAVAATALRDGAYLAASYLRGAWRRGTGWWTPTWMSPLGAGAYLWRALDWLGPVLVDDLAVMLGQAAGTLRGALLLDQSDDQVWHDGELWVTAEGVRPHLPDMTADNVRDWQRRGLIVDQAGVDRSRIGAGRRWWPLRDVRRAHRRIRGKAA